MKTTIEKKKLVLSCTCGKREEYDLSELSQQAIRRLQKYFETAHQKCKK